jgi:hypothetical protein
VEHSCCREWGCGHGDVHVLGSTRLNRARTPEIRGTGAEILEMAAHAWLGHPSQSSAGESYVGKPYENFDSSRANWSFLSAHPRP